MAECPECGTKVKAAPGKLTVCPECDTKFRARDNGDGKKPVAKKPAKPDAKKEPKKESSPPPEEEMYGFTTDEEDLGQLRKKREEEDKKKKAEKAKAEKPIIEVRRKNIGDLKVWERIDKSMNWLLAGVAVWGVAHLLFGVILFVGMVNGPEYAEPVVRKLVQEQQPPIEVGEGDALDRPAFVVAMLGGVKAYAFTMTFLIIIQVLGWARAALWVAGYSIALPSAPPDAGGKGQIIALYSLCGLNFVFAFFLLFLPLCGAYSYCPLPWMGSEMAMATFNMERTLPLHVFWACAPFWETLLAFILTTLVYLEPIMISYFIWTVAYTLKDDNLEAAAVGAVKFGFSVLFLMYVYQLVALAGNSPVLVYVMRVLYLVWFTAFIVWILRLVGMILKCRETFRFYFHPEED